MAAGLLVLPDPLAAVKARVPVAFAIHMVSGALVLLAAPLAFATRGNLAWHRPLGLAAGSLVLIAGLSALPVALAGTASPGARLAFMTQAVAWLALLCCGILAIRRRRRDLHRAAMIGLCAVTSAAIWLRPATAVAIQAGLDFEAAYAAIAWAAWLVPLLAATPVALAPRRGTGD